MLNAYPNRDNPVWIDLMEPTPEETAEAERMCRLTVPDRAALQEIEQSSRLREADGGLYLSVPLNARGEDGAMISVPTGFVLKPKAFVTVRFGPSKVFDEVRQALPPTPTDNAAVDIFSRLLEQVVDHSADHLELTADQVDKASHAIFHADGGPKAKRRSLSKDTQLLRQVMTDIGRASERMSKVRYTLVCIARMSQFVTDHAKDWIDAGVRGRLASVHADIASLEQYEEHLLSRVQLLQDAATAFISIEQNDVVKVLTIASVVGVPPVMVVGLYGMNFKYMPELNWHYGYAYALALIVVSTAVPLAWFKWKDWM